MKTPMHFAAPYLTSPTHPITVTLIGAGGTGSVMITELAKTNHCLKALGHPGLQVNLWDSDVVTEANRGRQLFADSEVGLCKSVARINNVNRAFGTNWKAMEERFFYSPDQIIKDQAVTNIYISCVDTVAVRFEIAEMLKDLMYADIVEYSKPFYWLDLGNGKHTGQGVLSTVGEIEQPTSKLYKPVGFLPMITDEFKELLEQEAATESNEPSCSTAEALEKQDLFINPTIASMGGSLIWRLFRHAMTENRGFFLNLDSLHCHALKVA